MPPRAFTRYQSIPCFVPVQLPGAPSKQPTRLHIVRIFPFYDIKKADSFDSNPFRIIGGEIITRNWKISDLLKRLNCEYDGDRSLGHWPVI